MSNDSPDTSKPARTGINLGDTRPVLEVLARRHGQTHSGYIRYLILKAGREELGEDHPSLPRTE